jgi:hypothetical protein
MIGSSQKSGLQAAGIWAADFALNLRIWGAALAVSCLLYLLLLGYLVRENTLPIWREVTWKLRWRSSSGACRSSPIL